MIPLSIIKNIEDNVAIAPNAGNLSSGETFLIKNVGKSINP